MHSKIIQIEPHPIEQPDMISPDYYPADHWFLQSIADYIDDDADDSVQSLIQLFASVCPDQFETFSDPNGRAIVFKDRFARSFLKKRSGDLRPLADFVRVIRPDTRYWFGGSVDYHA